MGLKKSITEEGEKPAQYNRKEKKSGARRTRVKGIVMGGRTKKPSATGGKHCKRLTKNLKTPQRSVWGGGEGKKGRVKRECRLQKKQLVEVCYGPLIPYMKRKHKAAR